jgi:hypothetical protein
MTGVPTVIVAAAAFVTGVSLGRSVDRQRDAAIKAAENDDPNWKWDDLLSHREEAPATENAALVVDDVLSQLPEAWLRRSEGVAREDGDRTGQINEDFERLVATKANDRLDETLVQSIRAELAPVQSVVQLARSLAGYRRGWREVRRERAAMLTPLPQTVEARVVARLLVMDSALRADSGDLDGALESCSGIMGVARSIGDEPFLYAFVIRREIGELAINSVQRVLGQGEPSDAALARVQAAVLDELGQPLLLVALQGERAALTERIRAVAVGKAPVTALRDSLNSPTNPRILPDLHAPWRGIWFEEQYAVTLEWMNRAVAIARGSVAEQPAN